MFKIKFDDSQLQGNLDKLNELVDKWWLEARHKMADALLVLSTYEVPHDTGQLQSTGHQFDEDEGGQTTVNVAYNTEYAAYQHEGMRKDGSRVIQNYQKGRKKKYLEDPLKNNISKWEQIGSDEVAAKLQGEL